MCFPVREAIRRLPDVLSQQEVERQVHRVGKSTYISNLRPTARTTAAIINYETASSLNSACKSFVKIQFGRFASFLENEL